ncbi:MAG: segregation and condensation protein A [Oscillochloridaceae bacterium umkhey_bin13]
MSYAIQLPSFNGPLDLLLRLIERDELDITTIALARVADQYLAHVRSLDAPEPRAMAEFVSLAARLILIKSRALLPQPTPPTPPLPADQDAEALAHQLREYRRYKQAAALLRSWHEDERRTFLRLAPLALELDLAPPPVKHSVADLINALQRRMQLALPLDDQPAPIRLGPRLTVAHVAERVRDRLAHQAWFSFEDLFDLIVTREDVIVTFWAVLELLKRQAITLSQDELFGTISIGRGTTGVDLATLDQEELRW